MDLETGEVLRVFLREPHSALYIRWNCVPKLEIWIYTGTFPRYIRENGTLDAARWSEGRRLRGGGDGDCATALRRGLAYGRFNFKTPTRGPALRGRPLRAGAAFRRAPNPRGIIIIIIIIAVRAAARLCDRPTDRRFGRRVGRRVGRRWIDPGHGPRCGRPSARALRDDASDSVTDGTHSVLDSPIVFGLGAVPTDGSAGFVSFQKHARSYIYPKPDTVSYIHSQNNFN